MRLAALLWLAIVAGAALYLLLRLHDGLQFQTNLLALLPQEERDPIVQHAKDKVAALFGQRIVLLVGHDERAAARSAGAELADTLAGSGIASSVSFTLPSDGLRRLGQMFFPYRFGLLTPADRRRLEEGRGAEIVSRALAMVYGPAPVADAMLLRRDPFLLLPSFLAELPTPLPLLTPDDGVLTVRDGTKTYVLVSAQLSGDAFALSFQDRFMRVLAAAEGKLHARLPGLQVLHFGAVFYAQAGAAAATAETSAISIVSLLGTVALVLAVFRALRPLWLTALAVAVGVVCAFSASLWLFGTLHVAALLFGVSLIGISLDYCLQYLSARFDRVAHTPQRRLNRVLPGISLGVGTTLIGYATLLFAPFPGLHQVAVFSAVGLVASFITVLLWLPALDGSEPFHHGTRLLATSAWLWSFWEEPRYRRPRWALVALCLALALLGTAKLRVDDDVRRLQPLSEDLKVQEAELRRLTGLGGGTEFLLVHAADGEHALQAEEILMHRLDAAKRAGALANYQALAQVIPSAARQQADRALVRDRLLDPFLASYYDRLGIADRGVMQDRDPGVLTPAAITADSPLSFLRSLLIEDEGAGATGLVLLQGVTRLDEVRQASEAVPGVRLVDPAGDVTRLLGEYRRRALMLLAVSAVLMLPVILWRYGRRAGLRVLLPPAAAVLLTPPLLALVGMPFTFFGAMALVLVLSIGFDYAVFCKETDPAQRPVTMLGVWLAMVTTLLSFGLLAFSRAFAVQAFGTALLVGTTLAFLASPLAGDSHGIHAKVKKN